MTTYQRIFGTGPRGLIISLVLLAIFAVIAKNSAYGPITGSDFLRYSIFGLSMVITTIIIFWSTKSLPPLQRGKKLVTRGAYKYFRHPYYGAFLTFFNVGLAVFLNDWFYLLWAIILHPLWHWNVKGEERLMKREFPHEYPIYIQKTRRFVPTIAIRSPVPGERQIPETSR